MKGKYILEKVAYEIEQALNELAEIQLHGGVSLFVSDRIAKLGLRLSGIGIYLDEKIEEIME